MVFPANHISLGPPQYNCDVDTKGNVLKRRGGHSKLLQVEHAAHLSPKARPVKLADKIANLRDVADSPPVNWPLARRQEYFDWAKQVVDKIPDPPAGLLSLFMAIYGRRP